MASQAILNSVQEIYIGLLGRSADNAGLQYWANQISTRVITIEQVRANIVNEQPEYAANLGSLTSRAVLIANLYGNLFNREPDAIGLEYWVNGGGKSVNADQLVLALVNGASAIDRLALDNRVVVANYFTNEAQFNIADAQNAILNVGASVNSVQVAIDKIANPNQLFTLTTNAETINANYSTTGIDTVKGVLGNTDLESSLAGTFSLGDKILGNGLTKLELLVSSAASTPNTSLVEMSGVDSIEFTVAAPVSVELDGRTYGSDVSLVSAKGLASCL